MKKVIIWFSCIIILTGCVWQESRGLHLDKKEALFDLQNQIGREFPIEQEDYVYRTRTGVKYHRYGCRYLRNSCEAMNLKDAERLGLKACRVCKPPLLGCGRQQTPEHRQRTSCFIYSLGEQPNSVAKER